MPHHHARRFAIAGVAVLAGSLLTAGPAAAELEADGTNVSIRTPSGGAYFRDFGERLNVSDYATDGRGVRAWLYYGSKVVALSVDDGVNNTREVDLEIKEGTPVRLKMCYTKEDLDVQCSRVQRGTA